MAGLSGVCQTHRAQLRSSGRILVAGGAAAAQGAPGASTLLHEEQHASRTSEAARWCASAAACAAACSPGAASVVHVKRRCGLQGLLGATVEACGPGRRRRETAWLPRLLFANTLLRSPVALWCRSGGVRCGALEPQTRLAAVYPVQRKRARALLRRSGVILEACARRLGDVRQSMASLRSPCGALAPHSRCVARCPGLVVLFRFIYRMRNGGACEACVSLSMFTQS